MTWIIAFIQNYGYASVFFFTLLEGEVVVALAGFIASEGYMSLPLVILTAIVGAIIGDNAYFLFGRYKGKQFIAARPKFQSRIVHVHRLIERYQDVLIVASRFMYGFRTVLPIAIGTSNVSFRRFLTLNAIGSIIWGVFFATGGYLFGHVMKQFIGHVQRAERFIVLGVLVGVALVQLILFFRRRVAKQIEYAEEILEQEDKKN